MDTPLNSREALLSFIKNRKGMLTAQHNFISTGDKYTNRVKEITGKTPLVWGSDFSFWLDAEDIGKTWHCGPMNVTDPGDNPGLFETEPETMRERLMERIIANHGKGHIITLMWHAGMPHLGDRCPYDGIWTMENGPDRRYWKELVTPGTELHGKYLAHIDLIAAYLKRLKDRGIPLIWRPYHEMNGVWFWWCNQREEGGFPALWRIMYERYTDYHGLDNLVWCWNTNAPRDIPGDEAYDYADFFPGHDVVDMLAADVYRRDYKLSHHDDLLALAQGKPIILGEVGELPSLAVLDEQPRWAWLMPWGNLLERLTPVGEIKDFYDDPRFVWLEDI